MKIQPIKTTFPPPQKDGKNLFKKQPNLEYIKKKIGG